MIINKSQALYTFVINKFVLQTNFMFLKTFNSEFSYIKVWFTTDLNSKPLQIEGKIYVTLVIN